MPSPRYSEAVRARRAELRAAITELAREPGELRDELALARLTALAELTTDLTRLGREARTYVDAAGRAGRARFPEVLATAAADLSRAMAARQDALMWAAAGRVAGRRGLRIEAHRAAGPPPPRLPVPDRPVPMWTGIAGGWRTALLPAAVLPLLGLPVAGTPGVLAAAGLGLLGGIAVGGHCAAAADRARLHGWSREVLLVLRAEATATLGRRLVEVEQAASAGLAAAARRRRDALDGELAVLAPGSGGA